MMLHSMAACSWYRTPSLNLPSTLHESSNPPMRKTRMKESMTGGDDREHSSQVGDDDREHSSQVGMTENTHHRWG